MPLDPLTVPSSLVGRQEVRDALQRVVKRRALGEGANSKWTPMPGGASVPGLCSLSGTQKP
jgi:hypothetical protein